MNRPARAVDRRPAGRAAGVALAIAFAAGPFPAGIAGASDSAAYEQETELRASQLLSAELLRGPHHSVDEKVTSDGLVPTYTVTTPYGTFQARGEEALRQIS